MASTEEAAPPAAEVTPPGALGVGAAGGVVGGLIGGGSGAVFVPALDRLTRLPRASLHGTSTMANIAVCATGAAMYAWQDGAVDLRTGSGLAVGGILGGVLGARLLSRVPERLLRLLFIGVLVLTGTKLFLDAVGLDPLGGAVLPASLIDDLWFVVPVSFLVGIVVGAWAGAMGMGGGLLAVPALVLLFGAGMHTAEGTALFVFVPNGIAGAAVHVRQGTAQPRIAGWINVGAIPGTIIGALLGLALNAEVLGVVFGVFALGMAAREVVRLRGAALPEAAAESHGEGAAFPTGTEHRVDVCPGD